MLPRNARADQVRGGVLRRGKVIEYSNDRFSHYDTSSPVAVNALQDYAPSSPSVSYPNRNSNLDAVARSVGPWSDNNFMGWGVRQKCPGKACVGAVRAPPRQAPRILARFPREGGVTWSPGHRPHGRFSCRPFPPDRAG